MAWLHIGDNPWLEPMTVHFNGKYMYHQEYHLPPEKNGRHLADDNFKCIFLNENDRIPNPNALKFLSRSPIDNKQALVQVMAWRRIGDKPLPDPMPTQFTDIYMWH